MVFLGKLPVGYPTPIGEAGRKKGRKEMVLYFQKIC